eukprot:2520238-Amphidinium_carterae.1
MKSRIGKGIGIDGIKPEILKHLPDTWCQIIPKCFSNSCLRDDIIGTRWSLQRMRPIPKQNKGKLQCKYYRGIVVSGVA